MGTLFQRYGISPKSEMPCLGGPSNDDKKIGGSRLGSPHLWKLPYDHFCELRARLGDGF